MNAQLLRAEMVRSGYTQSRLADELNMAQSTMVRKMKNGSFTVSEASEIVKILGIGKPNEIFFDRNVT